jgi:hypothetical protein
METRRMSLSTPFGASSAPTKANEQATPLPLRKRTAGPSRVTPAQHGIVLERVAPMP